MAVTTRMAAPNYKMYAPDELDAVYSKGTLDPIMGGIAFMYKNAKSQNSMMDQEEFMKQQAQYNRMAQNLDAMEIDSKTKQEAMKLGAQLIMKGEDPTKVQGGDSIYKNAGDSLLPGMLRNKIAADTAAAGRGGEGSGVKNKTTVTTTPPGTNLNIQYQHAGPPKAPSEYGGNDPRTAAPMPSSSPATKESQIISRIKTVTGVVPTRENTVPNGDGSLTVKGPKGSITMYPDGKEKRN